MMQLAYDQALNLIETNGGKAARSAWVDKQIYVRFEEAYPAAPRQMRKVFVKVKLPVRTGKTKITEYIPNESDKHAEDWIVF